MSPSSAQATACSQQPTLVALRAATHTLHKELDARSVLTNAEASQSMFRDYLLGVWPWLLAIDQGLWGASRSWPESLCPELRMSKRTWLEADLRALDCEIPLVPEARRFASRAEALGTAYVTEGMTLGGRVLSRRFASKGVSLRFFAGYGEHTGAMWKSLVEQIEITGANPTKRDTICRAALVAFHSFP